MTVPFGYPWCSECGMPVRKKGELWVHADNAKPISRIGYVPPHIPTIVLGHRP